MLYNLNWRKKDSFPAREVDTRSGVCLMKTRKKTKIKSSQISWLDAIKIASPLSADCILTEGLPQHAHCHCGGALASSQPLWWDLICSYMMSLNTGRPCQFSVLERMYSLIAMWPWLCNGPADWEVAFNMHVRLVLVVVNQMHWIGFHINCRNQNGFGLEDLRYRFKKNLSILF